MMSLKATTEDVMGSDSVLMAKGSSKMAAIAEVSPSLAASVVASNIVGNAVYLAAKRPDGQVEGVVVLVARERDGWTNVKIMDEGMGPYSYGASAEVLAALSPTDSVYAREWRAKCAACATLKVAAQVETLHDGGRLPAGSQGVIEKLTKSNAHVRINGKLWSIGRGNLRTVTSNYTVDVSPSFAD